MNANLPPLGHLRVLRKEDCTGAGTLQLVVVAKLHNNLVAKHAHANTLDVCAIVVVHDTQFEVY